MEKFDLSDYIFTFGVTLVRVSFGGNTDSPADWSNIPLVSKAIVSVIGMEGKLTLETKVALLPLLAKPQSNYLGDSTKERVRFKIDSRAQNKDSRHGYFEVTIYNAKQLSTNLDLQEAHVGTFQYEFEIKPSRFDDSGNPVSNKLGYLNVALLEEQESPTETI